MVKLLAQPALALRILLACKLSVKLRLANVEFNTSFSASKVALLHCIYRLCIASGPRRTLAVFFSKWRRISEYTKKESQLEKDVHIYAG